MTITWKQGLLRLWGALVLIWLVVAGGFIVYDLLRSRPNVPDKKLIESSLTLARPYQDKRMTGEDLEFHERLIREKNLLSIGPVTNDGGKWQIELKDGAVVGGFRSDTTAEEIQTLVSTYLYQRYYRKILDAAIICVAPPFVLLLLGVLTLWVLRGFRGTCTSYFYAEGNAMELKEFVTQSLVQLVQGIQQANVKLAGKEKTTADEKAFLLTYSGGDHPMGPHVEFDVAVSIKTDRKATAGASGMLYVVALEGSGSNSKIEKNVSRVRFAVLVKEHQG